MSITGVFVNLVEFFFFEENFFRVSITGVFVNLVEFFFFGRKLLSSVYNWCFCKLSRVFFEENFFRVSITGVFVNLVEFFLKKKKYHELNTITSFRTLKRDSNLASLYLKHETALS